VIHAGLVAVIVVATITVGRGLAPPTLAADTPAAELARARTSFRENAFAAALPLLNYLLYPTPRLARVEDLVEAHLLYGACSYEVGDRTTARREFEEALYLQADLELDTVLYSTGAVKFFEDTRAAINERSRLEDERRRMLEERDRYQQLLASLVVVEKRSYYINFIPFGAGQFQNRQRTKGLAFAVSQGLTGAASAGIWLYLVGSYGLSGQVPREDAVGVRRLQQIEIVSGTACIVLIAWGIVDSLIYYQPSAQRRPDESLLPPDLRRKPPTRPTGPPAAPPTSWMLAPQPLPGGAALSLTVEF
jgi:tetratricopeptide (TPR) repeat protein